MSPLSRVFRPFRSYQVPKEVGKVGTESPSYIEPVSQRKDGIEAMFAKAKSKLTVSFKPSAPPDRTMSTASVANPSPPSPPSQKRKRTLSPDPDPSLVSEVIPLPGTEVSSPSKRPFKVRFNYFNCPPPLPSCLLLIYICMLYILLQTIGRRAIQFKQPHPASPSSPKKPKNTPSSPNKTKIKGDNSSGSAKITSFFKKA